MGYDQENPSPSPKKKRGFAALDPARLKAITSAGGKAAHRKGTCHEFTREEARIAGRLGGLKTKELWRQRKKGGG